MVMSPALLLILGALPVPLLPGRVRSAWMVVIPIAALALLWSMPEGTTGGLTLLGLSLEPVRVDLSAGPARRGGPGRRGHARHLPVAGRWWAGSAVVDQRDGPMGGSSLGDLAADLLLVIGAAPGAVASTTVCSETCVCRLRCTGLFLDDVDRVSAASVEDEQDL
jgi:hypothetical protein